MDENLLESIGCDRAAETIVRLTALALSARTMEQPALGDESKPYIIVDDKVVDLEHLLATPIRKRETAHLHTVDSFCAYVNRHAHEDAAVVFFDENKSTFSAVLNYHPLSRDGYADWCDHRALYTMPASTEWQTWMRGNNAGKNQADFAQFIEDNLPDIIEPEGAKLLDMVKTLQAKRSVNFESAVRLDNGATEFVYLEDIKGTVTKGKVDIPTEFTIGIPPYRGEAPFKIVARLRYRIHETKLVLWFDLVRPHKVLEQVQREVSARIAEATKLPMFAGTL